MYRLVVIAIASGLVALVATGSRTEPDGSSTLLVTVTPAPEETAPSPEVAFALPEAPSAEPVVRTPEELEALYRFPKREEWESFSHRLDRALAEGSIEGLAALEPEARLALAALQAIPGHVEYAGWLEDRLHDIEVAQRAASVERVIAEGGDHGVPLYDVWVEWMRDRPPPARASHFVGVLKPIFVAEQLPPALVWIAETESSFNPRALSPAGARGLFQLMPATAQEMGLRLRPNDERLDPQRSARVAARYLLKLHGLYGDWPLALAAYNAGPTRVSRLLQQREAQTFAEIVDALPVETQLYVPKVLATLTVREGVTPGALDLAQTALAQHPNRE
jgi:membrane-bound lytic murein transglycosylase D